jgi:hypothetical protein
LTAELTGFKKWSAKWAAVGQTAVVDVGLELGSVETVIDVLGAVAPSRLKASKSPTSRLSTHPTTAFERT